MSAPEEQYTEEMFDELLDELYEDYDIVGITLSPSKILKECDPVAYRLTFNDWVDLQEEGE